MPMNALSCYGIEITNINDRSNCHTKQSSTCPITLQPLRKFILFFINELNLV